MQFFLSPFNCSKESIDCTGAWYYANAGIGLISAIALTIDAIVLKLTMFEIKNTVELDRNVSKFTGLFDIVIVISIVLLVVAFIIFDGYILILLSCFMSWVVYYLYNSILPHLNYYIARCHQIWILIFCLANFLALIGKVLENSRYDGNIALFLIGVVIIAVSNGISVRNHLNSVLVDMNGLKQGKEVVRLINALLQIIKEDELKARRNEILIQGYIHHYEEHCKDLQCSLKKYALCLSDDPKKYLFFYNHIEELYEMSLSKIRGCNSLRLSYAIFLIQYMKKKKQSMREFKVVENSFPSFEEEFIIFRYKKYFDEDSVHLNSKGVHEDTQNDSSNKSNLMHNYNFILFQKALKKISQLYIDFWTLLSNKSKEASGLNSLSELGTKITQKTEDIRKLFSTIQKINPKEPDLLFIYAEFMENILNKATKAEEYRKAYVKLIELKQEDFEDEQFKFEDNTLLSMTDDYQYIVISSSPSSMGGIINISLSLCASFGYLKNELVGNPFELLLPELYKQIHHQILNAELTKYKESLHQEASTSNLKPQYFLHDCFIKTKSKYLLPVAFKTAFIFTERHGILLIAKFSKKEAAKETECCVMTNNSFFIHSFTPNAIGALALKSSQMNNRVEITKYIKQFHEQYLTLALEREHSTPEEKLALKQVIIDKYSHKPRDIQWKLAEGTIQGIKSIKDSFDVNSKRVSVMLACREIDCTVSVEKLMIQGNKVGYLFRFENISGKVAYVQAFHKPKKTEYNSVNCNSNSNVNCNSSSALVVPSPRQLTLDFQWPNKNINFFSQNNQAPPSNPIKQSNSDYLAYIKEAEFIPFNAKTSFQIDLKSLAYKANAKNQDALKTEVKRLVDDKIIRMRNERNKTKEASSENEDEFNDSDDDDDNEDSSNYSSSNAYVSEANSPINSNKNNKASNLSRDTPAISLPISDSYYKVNLNLIKLLQYNYQKSVFDSIAFEKKSQVEIRKRNEKEEESKLSQLNPDDKSKQKKSMSANDQNDRHSTTDNQIEQEDLHSKKIEYALEKEESQPTIARLKCFSLISFFILIAYIGAWLAYFIISSSLLSINFLNLRSTFHIIINNSYSFIKVKELTLLQHNKYHKYLHDNKTEDIYLVLNEINELALETAKLLNSIQTSKEFLNKELAGLVKAANVTMSIIKYNTLQKIDYEVDLLTALTQGNTELFLITSEVVDYSLRERNIYFVLTNVSGGMTLSLSSLLGMYYSSYGYNVASIQKNYIIIFVMSIPIVIALYFLMSWSFAAVSMRKDNYLEVFFKIHKTTIKALLAKCEKFSLQIQTESFSEFITLSDNISNAPDDSIALGGNNSKDLNKSLNKGKVKGNISSEPKAIGKAHCKEHSCTESQKNLSKEMRVIKIWLVIVFFIQFLLFFSLFIICYVSYAYTYVYVTLFLNQNYDYYSYIMLYANYRELVTQTYSFLGVEKEKDKFNLFLVNFYNKVQGMNSNNNMNLPPTFIPYYEKLFKQSLCDVPELALPQEINCRKIFFGSAEYGLGVLSMTFYNEVTFLKSINDKFSELRQEHNFTYNITVEGTEYEEDYLPPESEMANYSLYHPITELNTIHYFFLNQAYAYFLEPAIKLLFNKLGDSIVDVFVKVQGAVIFFIIGFFLLDFLAYLLVWKPFEARLDSILHKTKNLLSIIPSDVLGKMSSARALLGINNTNTLNNRKPM